MKMQSSIIQPFIQQTFTKHLSMLPAQSQLVGYQKRYGIVLIWRSLILGAQRVLEQGPLEGAKGSPEPNKAWHRLPGNL